MNQMGTATISCLLAMAIVTPCAADGGPSGEPTVEARIDSIGSYGASVQLSIASAPQEFAITDTSVKEALKTVEAGDTIKVAIDQSTTPNQLKRLTVVSHSLGLGQRMLFLALAAAFVFAMAALVVRGSPLRFLVGVDGRYSNSQFQIALWFYSVMTVYLATMAARIWVGGLEFLGGVEIPTNLLALSGLSALTFGAAKAITAQKVDNLAAGAVCLKTSSATARFPDDLVRNDLGAVDIGDFQMLFITILAVIIHVSMTVHFLGSIALVLHVTLPDVDSTLLSGFGLGQGAYLIKKAASRLGEG